MEIVFVGAAMPFGPETLAHKSLGGSETAMLHMATELAKAGNIVNVFTNLPPEGQPDHIPSGTIDANKVRWVDIRAYQQFIQTTEVDLLVIWRMPELAAVAHQARKCVLWLHDIMIFNQAAQHLFAMAWNIDEVWTVSEWHRQQVHKVTGLPLDAIWATRNGITRAETQDYGRDFKQLVFASRPERGLQNILRPGGLAEKLPEFRFKIAYYDNPNPNIADFYGWCRNRMDQLPNVEYLGPLKQSDLRQLIKNSGAYVYPIDFEDTSNIMARECIEQHTPFLTTRAYGAVSETLGRCGYYIEDHFSVVPEYGSDAWIEHFAKMVREFMASPHYRETQLRMRLRQDLYWDEVAQEWLKRIEPKPVTVFSRAVSLLKDSNIIPLKAFLEANYDGSPGLDWVDRFVKKHYPMVYGAILYPDYYANLTKWIDKNEPECRSDPIEVMSQGRTARFDFIGRQIQEFTKPGDTILDYGCAHGSIVLPLAASFPDRKFVAVDFDMSNLDMLDGYAKKHGITNIRTMHADGDWRGEYDAAVLSEILEHVEEPWALVDRVEAQLRIGGRAIVTVPYGVWDYQHRTAKRDKPFQPTHIWHLDKQTLRTMFADKQNCRMERHPSGQWLDGKLLGHTCYSYEADHTPAHPLNPLAEALRAPARQSCGLAMIAMNNEDCILHALDSVRDEVDYIRIAHGPSSDDTLGAIERWKDRNPFVYVEVVPVRRIEAEQFGFDDARNISIDGLPTDWVLWLDTDEYVSGHFSKYLRNNSFAAYAVSQHHFSCEPKGAPAMIDRPARLFRNFIGFKFWGKIHEHAERGYNGGPGHVMLLGDVDIGHPGYVNEEIRRKRFARNWPLLVWDRRVYPDRKLGSFLWLRDIVHRMRLLLEQRNGPEAARLANEAVIFYESNWKDMEATGTGMAMALAYYSEALGFLNRGTNVQLQLTIDNLPVNFSARIESPDVLIRIIDQTLKPELDRRNGKYWLR